MKRFIPAMIAAVLISGSAYAQSINVGPGGVSVDTRSPQERVMDREMRRDRYERQREREWRRANSRDKRCRTITTQRETPRGVISRTERVCD
ncbi:hypothetical protein [Bosea sp. (in: a-proteobacteria)]|nr:hypothetical protein [Bosea sp. (in: a-proteobacteria)]SIP90726.1 hypothetical protein SAMN05880592_101122 [Bosea sp. TND4EK4]